MTRILRDRAYTLEDLNRDPRMEASVRVALTFMIPWQLLMLALIVWG